MSYKYRGSASMSQYRPQFFIKITDSETKKYDPDVSRSMLHEIAQRSITPTTLESVAFFDHEYDTTLISSILSEVDKKANLLRTSLETAKRASDMLAESQGQLAVAFKSGEFNKPSQEFPELQRNLEAKIGMLANCFEEIKLYGEVLIKHRHSFLIYEEKYSVSTNHVTRFGINNGHENSEALRDVLSICRVPTQLSESKSSTKKSSKSSAKDDREVTKILHPLEILLINKALKFLYTTDATTVTKTVLIDIFERQEDGSIILHDDLPGVHTVILYKLGVDDDVQTSEATTRTSIKQKLLVIDPSSSDFSKHIIANIERICVGNDIKIDMDYLSNSSGKTLKIYSPRTQAFTGPNPDQYRDCTDIAVKIALGLNKLPGMASGQEVLKSHAIKMVTNQMEVCENLFFESNVIARIRQASDDYIRTNVHKLLFTLDHQCYDAKLNDQLNDQLKVTHNTPIYQKILSDSTSVFTTSYFHDKYSQCLDDLRGVCSLNHAKIIGATKFDGGES